MSTTCALPREVDFGRGAATPTQVLHASADGKPAIALTTCKDGQDTTPLQRFYKLIEPSLHTPNSALEWPALAEREEPELVLLKQELEKHFGVLKSEFEERTGRSWTPLRGWDEEDREWEWEWEDGKGDEDWEVV